MTELDPRPEGRWLVVLASERSQIVVDVCGAPVAPETAEPIARALLAERFDGAPAVVVAFRDAIDPTEVDRYVRSRTPLGSHPRFFGVIAHQHLAPSGVAVGPAGVRGRGGLARAALMAMALGAAGGDVGTEPLPAPILGPSTRPRRPRAPRAPGEDLRKLEAAEDRRERRRQRRLREAAAAEGRGR